MKTANTLSPWFTGDVKPARDGVYLRQLQGLYFHSRFLDGRWRAGYIAAAIFKPREAVGRALLESRHQHAQWCGLARDPATIVK